MDLELLSSHAEGDSRTLLGQFAALLIFFSVILALGAGFWAAATRTTDSPRSMHMIGAWTAEHFLIATTMLAVGLFAVLSWESTFPDRRDVLVLGPLPVRARTLFLAKVAAVATALGLTVASLHALAGIAWPLALAQFDSTPAPALVFDPALPPVRAADFPAVMNRDIAPMLRRLDLAAADGGAGIVIGISEHGMRRVMAYGAAKPDSLFEIGSITKTFTGLLLAQMAVRRNWTFAIRSAICCPWAVPAATGASKSRCSIWPRTIRACRACRITPAQATNARRTRITRPPISTTSSSGTARKGPDTQFLYSNLGFTVLGAALANRARAAIRSSRTRDHRPARDEGHGHLALARTARPLDARLRRPTAPHSAMGPAGRLRQRRRHPLHGGRYAHLSRSPTASRKVAVAAALVESQRLRAHIAGAFASRWPGTTTRHRRLLAHRRYRRFHQPCLSSTPAAISPPWFS